MLKILKFIKKFNPGKALESLFVNSKVDLLNETLNSFLNFIPCKKIKCDYFQPPSMTDSIKRSLKEPSKLTKYYYKNGPKKIAHEKLLEKCSDCTKEIVEAKNNYILQVPTKPQDSKTAAKMYWAFLSRLIYNKKNPAIPPLLLNG